MICNGLSGSPAICILSPYLRGANFDINHWRTLVHPNQSRSGDNRHKGRLFGTSLRASRCAVVRVGRIDMKLALAAATAALLLTAQTVTADAKGCIKGALVGGAAGHMVGHGKMGAVAGCVVGHHNANKKQKQQQEQQNGSSSKLKHFP